MGWFTSSKQLNMRKLDLLLKKIKTIDPKEREYIKGVFRQYESGGITKREVEFAIRDLRTNRLDQIDRQEADAVERELLEFLGK